MINTTSGTGQSCQMSFESMITLTSGIYDKLELIKKNCVRVFNNVYSDNISLECSKIVAQQFIN